jgi:hypothetical protein
MLKMFINVCTIFFALTTIAASGQSEMSLSFPIIYSTVTVKDNWTPPTAPAYKEYLDGSAIGYGANVNYLFRPGLLLKNKNFRITVGAGYFNQKFNIIRPFNYSSQIYIGFYTEDYSYHCLQGAAGLAYSYPLGKRYFLSSQLTYNWLHSFKQKYSPTREDFPTQVNKAQISFGNMLLLSVEGQRMIGKNLSMGLNIVAPLYTKWRNDNIFDDDPSTFFHPKFSLGASLNVVYHFMN